MIYSWPSLREISSHSLSDAREELISLLINYQGYKGYSLIVVFDGNRRKGNPGSSSKNGSASIVYTPSGISADAWIEKKAADLKGKFHCIAATSDGLIQNSVFSHGATRISARELERAVLSVNESAFAALKSIKNDGLSMTEQAIVFLCAG
ncbi:NYN domain-containing protein [Allobaculum sp. Allo2]|uniref:NYN domain-containing protein n=1 Tax=Allobaculum sp. Allo2 TaxID=2853432 RepID=UPI001F6095DD|nr:NYN domain-containing protein [Allobaculum sp. Allo2]UNT92759.1 NYN domain-containing protein [Allobaculum sp. Allo2]